MSVEEKILKKAKLMEDDDLPTCWGNFVLFDDVLKILKGKVVVEQEKLQELEKSIIEFLKIASYPFELPKGWQNNIHEKFELFGESIKKEKLKNG